MSRPTAMIFLSQGYFSFSFRASFSEREGKLVSMSALYGEMKESGISFPSPRRIEENTHR
jgi:hypothetical protein